MQKGETVIILHGTQPVGKLTSADMPQPHTRPKVGTATSDAVTYSDDAFTPVNDKNLAEWGL